MLKTSHLSRLFICIIGMDNIEDYFSKPELSEIVNKVESSFPNREIDSIQISSIAETICDNVQTTIVNVDVRTKCSVDKIVQEITIKNNQ